METLSTTSELEDKTVGVFLTEQDAEIFKKFQQYYKIWSQIFSRDNRSTEITLFFNSDGELRIVKELKTFKN